MPSVVTLTQEKLHLCMQALKEISKVWLAARTVRRLFELVLGNKSLEHKLQKAAGKRHKKVKTDMQSPSTDPDSLYRQKYGNLPSAYVTGPPAPQISYERSRPQSPSPNSMLKEQLRTSLTSNPTMMTADAFHSSAGASCEGTNPPTPQNPFSLTPASPHSMRLVTRDSPLISQQLLENFRPGDLFPEYAQPASAQQYTDTEQPLDQQYRVCIHCTTSSLLTKSPGLFQ